jgi:hypothetical protein
VFLWGDSFAQALAPGLRAQLPADTALAQVTTSSCRAGIDNFDVVRGRRCETANLYAMESIRRLRPALVIVAQSGAHAATDWAGIAKKVLELGAAQLAVVGPFPTWRTGLPRVFAEHHLHDRPAYVATGISAELFEQDRLLAERVSGLPRVTYVSLVAALCRDGACLARVPGADDLDLMAMDIGHLTPKGSAYVAREVLQPVLDQAGVR